MTRNKILLLAMGGALVTMLFMLFRELRHPEETASPPGQASAEDDRSWFDRLLKRTPKGALPTVATGVPLKVAPVSPYSIPATAESFPRRDPAMRAPAPPPVHPEGPPMGVNGYRPERPVPGLVND
jgi:hypothetical protein